MDLPFDDWVDLTDAGMRLLSVHLPRGGCCLAVFDAERDRPEGTGLAAHADALLALGYAETAAGDARFWVRPVTFTPSGLARPGHAPDVGAHVAAFRGARPARYARAVHHADKSGRDPATLPGRQEQAFRDLYLRALARVRSTMAAMARSGEIADAGEPGGVMGWEQAVGAVVSEVPGRELRAMVGVMGGAATPHDLRCAVRDAVRWRLDPGHLREAWIDSGLGHEDIEEFQAHEIADLAVVTLPQ